MMVILTTGLWLSTIVLFFFLGRISGASEALKSKPKALPPPPPDPPEAMCGCKHHYAFHNKDGKCQQMVKVSWDRLHEKYQQQSCPCQGYSGPEPLFNYL